LLALPGHRLAIDVYSVDDFSNYPAFRPGVLVNVFNRSPPRLQYGTRPPHVCWL